MEGLVDKQPSFLRRLVMPLWFRARARARRLGPVLVELNTERNRTIILMLMVGATLAATPLGHYLDQEFFYEPLQRARGAIDLAPKLDSRIRLVLADDRSLTKIGRLPTFAEWQQIAKRLFELGFDHALLLGFHNLRSEIGAVEARHERGRFIAGTVAVRNKQNSRAILAETLPTSLTESHNPYATNGLGLISQIQAPAPEIFAAIDALGSLDLNDDNTMNVGLALADGRFIPNLSMLARTGETLRFPPYDGKIHSDYVPLAGVLASSLPVSAFYSKTYDRIVSISDKMREKLTGGTIALLVPSASTGERFNDTPLGKMPAYASVVAAINAALAGRPVVEPYSAWRLLPGHFILSGFLAITFTLRVTVAATIALTFVYLLFGSALFQTHGLLLPIMQAVALLAVGVLHRLATYALSSAIERKALARDLAVGQSVQQFLLPRCRSGSFGEWDYRVVFKPYGYMSGDWYQFYETPPDAQKPFALVAIGDVVGKGPSAALITAVIANTWQSFESEWARNGLDLQRFLQALDHSILRTFDGQQNSTLTLAVLRPGTITLVQYASPSWVIAVRDTALRLKIPARNPLGLPHRTPKHFEKEFAPEVGDIFIGFTDGVIDGSNTVLQFTNALNANLGRRDEDGVFDRIENFARTCGAATALPDDFTMLIIRRRCVAGAAAKVS